MFKKETAVKKSKPAASVFPQFKGRVHLMGKAALSQGFINFVRFFFLFAGLIFRQDALANLYDDFNISPSATQEEIEKAWKKQVGSYHPDKHINGEDGLSKSEAHEIFTFLNRKQTLEEIKAEDVPKLRPYKDLKIGFYILRDPILREKHDEWLKTPDREENRGGSNYSGSRSDGRGFARNGAFRDTSKDLQTGINSENRDTAGNLIFFEVISLQTELARNELRDNRWTDYLQRRHPKREKKILRQFDNLFRIGGVDLSAQNNEGETVLHLVIASPPHFSYFKVAEWLVQRGAKIHIQDMYGRFTCS